MGAVTGKGPAHLMLVLPRGCGKTPFGSAESSWWVKQIDVSHKVRGCGWDDDTDRNKQIKEHSLPPVFAFQSLQVSLLVRSKRKPAGKEKDYLQTSNLSTTSIVQEGGIGDDIQ